MFVCRVGRGNALALAVLATVSLIPEGQAVARSKAKPYREASLRVDDIPIPKFSDRIQVVGRPGVIGRNAAAGSVAPMRFFTINGALAKFEGRPVPVEKFRVAALEPQNQISDALAPVPPASRSNEPFGMFAFRAPEGVLWSKWKKIQGSFEDEDRRIASCRADADACDGATRTLINLAGRAGSAQGRARFELVSHAVNAAVRYTSDYAQHGIVDVWTPPLATLEAGRGDCEDYAILKYRVLREAGTPAADLKIVLLRDTASREDHAVLAARSGDQWFILDNRRAGFYSDQALPHYLPLFALSDGGVQLFAAPYAARQTILAEEPMPASEDNGSMGSAHGTQPLFL